MKLLWIFRAVFLIVIVAVISVNIQPEIMLPDAATTENPEQILNNNLRAIFWSSLAMVFVVLMLDILTPKKKLSAVAGVFFGLLIGIMVS